MVLLCTYSLYPDLDAVLVDITDPTECGMYMHKENGSDKTPNPRLSMMNYEKECIQPH